MSLIVFAEYCFTRCFKYVRIWVWILQVRSSDSNNNIAQKQWYIVCRKREKTNEQEKGLTIRPSPFNSSRMKGGKEKPTENFMPSYSGMQTRKYRVEMQCLFHLGISFHSRVLLWWLSGSLTLGSKKSVVKFYSNYPTIWYSFLEQFSEPFHGMNARRL